MRAAKEIPNLLSLLRIVGSPTLIMAGFHGFRTPYLAIFSILILSDFLDGALARCLNTKSVVGAKLDSLGDIAMYASASAGAWLLWPDLIKGEIIHLSLSVSLLGFSCVVCLVKHGQIPSYHTWSAKIASATLGVAAVLMFAGVSKWPFRISVGALAFAALEEMTITLVLPKWRPNVRTIAHAIALRRGKAR